MKHFRTILLLALALTLALGTALGEGDSAEYANAMIRETNVERARYGLSQLRVDPVLTEAARVRCEEITRKFSHTRPDGSAWRTVSPVVYGENIARGHNNPDRVLAAWMTSAGHRQNILRASFGSIGGWCIQQNGICYWVQLFGR